MNDSINDSETKNPDQRHRGAGIAIGIALGIALGAALDNIGLGIALGVALGAAYEWRADNSSHDDDNTNE